MDATRLRGTEHLLLLAHVLTLPSCLVYLFLTVTHLLTIQHFNFLSVLLSLALKSAKLSTSSVTCCQGEFFFTFAFFSMITTLFPSMHYQ